MNDCDCGVQVAGEFVDTGLSWIVTTVLVLLAVFLYFVPSIIGRNRRAIAPIFIINLFLGWTFLGWLLALCWATTPHVSGRRRVRKHHRRPAPVHVPKTVATPAAQSDDREPSYPLGLLDIPGIFRRYNPRPMA